MQPVTHLNLMSLAPGKVHQGATNVAAQLEHFPVDVKILAIATACQGRGTKLVTYWEKVFPLFFFLNMYIHNKIQISMLNKGRSPISATMLPGSMSSRNCRTFGQAL